MANIFDYLQWRGDLPFNKSPFNPVDNIILSQLSYLTFDGIVPGPKDKCGISIDLAVRLYNEKLKEPGFKLTSIFKQNPDLIRALGASRRFGNCQLFGFVNHFDTDIEIQFTGLCIHTDDDYCFVSYRGTDASMVGWKEDFNMSFKEVIPSQIEAVNYLNKMAPQIEGKLRIGGHSKGGNLAIYAASFCKKIIQKRISVIYNNDAPGFHESVITSNGYNAIKDRIVSFVPQSSVIGMFLEHGENLTVIKSSEIGLAQHNLFSWKVTYNDLVRAEKSTIGSRFVNKSIREWLNSIEKAQREQFIEALYHILTSAEIKSTADLEDSMFKSVGRVLKSLSKVEESKRKMIGDTFRVLFRTAGRNAEAFIKEKLGE